MVGAGEGAASHCAEGVGVFGVVGPIRCLLHRLHEAADEEVVLQCRDALLGEDGRLPTHGTGQRQALGRDIVLEASGQGGKGGGAASVHSSHFPWVPIPLLTGCCYTSSGNLSGLLSCQQVQRPHLSQLSGNTSLTSRRGADISAFLSVHKHRFSLHRC